MSNGSNELAKEPLLGLSRAAFGKDFLASIVVFLVALPLCMGIAIASGVPPALGLITGIVGGLVVGWFSGSPLQVSGPAAGLTVLVYEVIQAHGIAALGLIVLIAGLIQLVAGALKLGNWFRAISPAVIQGLLAGIGVLIIASQIHVAVDDAPRGTGWQNILSIPEAIWKGIVPLDGSAHHLAAGVGLAAIMVMIVWSYVPKKVKLIPAPLVAVIVATVINSVLDLPIKTVAVPANLLEVAQAPSFSMIGTTLSWSLFGSAFAIAMIASAETLLSATAVDRLQNGPRTQYNRELFAQGVGNSVCGLLGALPMTGVIVRSSANVTAGAQTRMSAILHGAWILAFVVLLPSVLSLIPTSALAAILVYTGFKLLAPKAVKELAKYGRAEVAIYFITIIAIVATNLLEGVLIGLGLSLLKLIYKFTHLDAKISDGSPRVLTLSGAATFVRLPKLAHALESIPAESSVRLNVERLMYIDHACLDLIANWDKQFVSQGGEVELNWKELNNKYHGAIAVPEPVVEKVRPATAKKTLAAQAGAN